MAQAIARTKGAAPRKILPARKAALARSRFGLLAGTFGAMIALAAVASVWLAKPTAEPPTGQILAVQMEAAAGGRNLDRHVFGGAIGVSMHEGRVAVTAEAVPSNACVSAGTRLAHSGVVSVNGNTPVRVSASRMTTLCFEQPTATLVWQPKGKE